MDVQAIFGLQFLLSIIAWSVAFAFLLSPTLARLPRREALMWLSLPHAFRHVGLTFLVPGVVDQPLPAAFANPAAYGDLTAGMLALLAIVALRYRWTAATGLVWLFNVVGTLDLANALRIGAPSYLAWPQRGGPRCQSTSHCPSVASSSSSWEVRGFAACHADSAQPSEPSGYVPLATGGPGGRFHHHRGGRRLLARTPARVGAVLGRAGRVGDRSREPGARGCVRSPCAR